MLSVDRALGSDRLMKSLTGLAAAEFLSLAAALGSILQEDKWSMYIKGLLQRIPGGGRIGHFACPEDKLFFALFYMKVYPTFEVLGYLFDMDNSSANRQIQKLFASLEKALGKKLALPKRRISSVEEFFKSFPEAKSIFIDGTERPIRRPKDNDKQKGNYSGKKKAHTKKNLVICDDKKKIGFLGQTHEGRMHDYGIIKGEISPDALPKGIDAYADKGFIGIEKDYPNLSVHMPKKKPRWKDLTLEEKEKNKAISRTRIKVEHAICGIKKFAIMSGKLRSIKEGLADQAILLCTGLHNFRIMGC